MRPSGNTSLKLRKGAWTAEEDMLLKKCIERYGEGKWHLVPLKACKTTVTSYLASLFLSRCQE